LMQNPFINKNIVNYIDKKTGLRFNREKIYLILSG
jgi:hypothetical protein